MNKLALILICSLTSASAWAVEQPASTVVHIAPYRPIGQAVPAIVANTSAALGVMPVTAGSPATAVALAPLTISASDGTLRAALERWLKAQGWQLAWDVDSDLPVEFDAQFSGDFDGVLRQAMQATDHMRQPTRACVHPNQVVRIVARAASCNE
ncbi:toxin co-regulated pilus biosynthesis Q family protein [Burkholderia cepacia]|uniref:toxin co-regulated pilus biosynthesis Q family protein n=1 Tax=Burkholderia cepacia TaxID=292 RepID=UPI002ABE44BA|nr:toxin co-regulated pilus biosynthesis Q family protein [Burkholderia cepacia]